MRKLTRSETADFLRQNNRYVILTHRRPDGDTLGSAAALCRGLRLLGKEAWVLNNEEATDRLRWLITGLTVEQLPENICIVSTDVASPDMLPVRCRSLLGSVRLRIDHHGVATSFTDVELVEPDSASCAEVVWEVLRLLSCPRDKDVMQAVYVGISTDTGCFRFSNTTQHTFRTAADCAESGAEIYRLNQELFETNSLQRLKMQGWIVEHLQFLRNETMAVCAIPRSVELALGTTEDDMDNISNFPRTVAGVHMASTLRETTDGESKLSVRAVPGYDATRVAAQFGGGGHVGAAGANLHMPLEQAAEAVRRAMEAL